MRRDQLEHAIRAACAIIGRSEVVIVGSQAILGTWDEHQLPPRATASNEVDVMALDADAKLVAALSDSIEGAAGEMSLFHQTHGFYLDGVDHSTAILPRGWEDRLVPVQGANTEMKTGWCLNPYDLCASKLAAHRSKDQEFVAALLDANMVHPIHLERAVREIPATAAAARERALRWLSARCGPDPHGRDASRRTPSEDR